MKISHTPTNDATDKRKHLVGKKSSWLRHLPNRAYLPKLVPDGGSDGPRYCGKIGRHKTTANVNN
jgi:hypothetical protein